MTSIGLSYKLKVPMTPLLRFYHLLEQLTESQGNIYLHFPVYLHSTGYHKGYR